MKVNKFRGLNQNKWFYGDLLNDYHTKSNELDEVWSKVIHVKGSYISISCGTESQYSGLNDTKGVEIYDGDICEVEILRVGKGKCQIVFYCGCMCILNNGKDHLPLIEYFERNDIIIEVIGNIHQNPELLK